MEEMGEIEEIEYKEEGHDNVEEMELRSFMEVNIGEGKTILCGRGSGRVSWRGSGRGRGWRGWREEREDIITIEELDEEMHKACDENDSSRIEEIFHHIIVEQNEESEQFCGEVVNRFLESIRIFQTFKLVNLLLIGIKKEGTFQKCLLDYKIVEFIFPLARIYPSLVVSIIAAAASRSETQQLMAILQTRNINFGELNERSFVDLIISLIPEQPSFDKVNDMNNDENNGNMRRDRYGRRCRSRAQLSVEEDIKILELLADACFLCCSIVNAGNTLVRLYSRRPHPSIRHIARRVLVRGGVGFGAAAERNFSGESIGKFLEGGGMESVAAAGVCGVAAVFHPLLPRIASIAGRMESVVSSWAIGECAVHGSPSFVRRFPRELKAAIMCGTAHSRSCIASAVLAFAASPLASDADAEDRDLSDLVSEAAVVAEDSGEVGPSILALMAVGGPFSDAVTESVDIEALEEVANN